MMTPKDKAEELVHKMYAGFVNSLYSYKAKQCALIAVDEIIKETKLHDKTIYQHTRTFYWQEVKTEIKKL